MASAASHCRRTRVIVTVSTRPPTSDSAAIRARDAEVLEHFVAVTKSGR